MAQIEQTLGVVIRQVAISRGMNLVLNRGADPLERPAIST